MSITEFQPKQVYEQVADSIRHRILTGLYTPDSRLPSERELALTFNVGRPAVREAIGALQNEGLVITRQGSGTYVLKVEEPIDTTFLDPQSFSKNELVPDLSPVGILEARLILEPSIVRLAARLQQRDALAEHYLKIMAEVEDLNDKEQAERWKEADRLFHRQIAIMTKNNLMISIANEVAKAMDQPLWNRLRLDGIYDPERISLYVAEHRMIYEAIISGDEDAAAFYVEGHLKRVSRDIMPK